MTPGAEDGAQRSEPASDLGRRERVRLRLPRSAQCARGLASGGSRLVGTPRSAGWWGRSVEGARTDGRCRLEVMEVGWSAEAEDGDDISIALQPTHERRDRELVVR